MKKELFIVMTLILLYSAILSIQEQPKAAPATSKSTEEPAAKPDEPTPPSTSSKAITQVKQPETNPSAKKTEKEQAKVAPKPKPIATILLHAKVYCPEEGQNVTDLERRDMPLNYKELQVSKNIKSAYFSYQNPDKTDKTSTKKVFCAIPSNAPKCCYVYVGYQEKGKEHKQSIINAATYLNMQYK